jgi:hypothetical protein
MKRGDLLFGGHTVGRAVGEKVGEGGGGDLLFGGPVGRGGLADRRDHRHDSAAHGRDRGAPRAARDGAPRGSEAQVELTELARAAQRRAELGEE